MSLPSPQSATAQRVESHIADLKSFARAIGDERAQLLSDCPPQRSSECASSDSGESAHMVWSRQEILRVTTPPPLQLSWRYTYADPCEEAEQVAEELRPMMGRRLFLVGRFFAGMSAWVVAREAWATRAEPSAFLALALAALCAHLAMMTVGLRSERWGLRYRTLEAVAVAIGMVHTLVQGLAFVPYRLDALFGAEPPATAQFRMSVADARLRVALIPVAYSVFLPMQPLGFGVLGGWIFTQAISVWWLLPPPPSDGSQDLGSVITLCTIVVMAMFSRVYVVLSRRGQWHYKRTVRRALVDLVEIERARRRLESAEALQKTALLTAQVAQGARSRLIRMVMHDLRSPLLSVVNIAASVDAMPAGTVLGDARMRSATEALSTCATLMEQIVSDMLDFERIDSGRLVLVPAPFHVSQLLRDALATFAGLAHKKGVEMSTEALPDELASRWFVGDSRRLQQCLNNGISNAIKFTERGGSVRVSAYTAQEAAAETPSQEASPAASDAEPAEGTERAADGARDDDGDAALLLGADDDACAADAPLWRVHVCVTDTGVGLDADELAALQSGDLFQQVGKGQLQGNGGTGLGLSITRQLLALHSRSTLHLSSAGARQGTSFELRLRLREAHGRPVRRHSSLRRCSLASSAPAETEELERADGAAHADSLEPSALQLPPAFRVLYAEDDAFLQMSMQARLFGPYAVAVDMAHDGQEALEAVTAELGRYDLVLLDNQMPRMNGTTATRRMREAGYAGVIIGMTGDPAGCPERAEFEASGLDSCIDKDNNGVQSIIALLFELSQQAAADVDSLELSCAEHPGAQSDEQLGPAAGADGADVVIDCHHAVADAAGVAGAGGASPADATDDGDERCAASISICS